ncbi:hypothetical protein SAMN04487866_12132 [Thermoactinomyces sp. DSM 45891]|uniref:hypothetical protein n=1 Tax=Thermoactinomyces sp. DSM 45891 TaxID=1761907 RepID=UPI00091C650D|nr:hypothetical protein [Thermoactinomyces sp. DSM 45891]SFX74016.1 hypothetical protein SAMN04487866_12132 [Thermoactinomyces sp. DSM 45891]
MIFSRDTKEIMEEYDFTDSFIENIRWEKNLLDLSMDVNYFWTERDGEKLFLKIIFKNCLKADFNMVEQFLDVPRKEVKEAHIGSWFTIVKFILNEKSPLLSQCNRPDIIHLDIYTVELDRPWLSILCTEVQVEEIKT